MTADRDRFLRSAADALSEAHRLAKIGGQDQVRRAEVFQAEADKWIQMAQLFGEGA